jgi:hypothetical protein
MEPSRISFSDKGEELFKKPEIQEGLEVINKDSELEPHSAYATSPNCDAEICAEEYVRSSLYSSFSEQERSKVLRYLGNAAGWEKLSSDWVIESAYQTEGLFDLPQRIRLFNPSRYDGLLLSGLFSLDFQPDTRDELLENHDEYGFQSRFDMAVFLGACAARKMQNDEIRQIAGGDYLFPDGEDANKRIIITGDFHGDFRLAEDRRYKNGSISPLGDKLEFAPVERTAVGAYHSSETTIMASVAKQVLKIRPARDERANFCHNAIRIADLCLVGQERAAGFADYGDDYTDPFLLSEELEGDTLLAELPVIPHSDTSLQVLSGDNGLKFITVYGNSDTGESIEIKNDELGLFAVALIVQCGLGQGRTAPGSVIKILQDNLLQ